MKKVIFADNTGYCYGVKRCIDMADKALESRPDVYCMGEIIHNTEEMDRLRQKGLSDINSLEGLSPGAVFIIRSHGVSSELERELLSSGAEIIDTTCPHVKRIHNIIAQCAENGRRPIIIGNAEHPEVSASKTRCENTLVFSGPEELEAWSKEDKSRKSEPLTVVFQTTFTKSIFDVSKKLIKKLYTNCEVFDTICTATQIRQEEADKLSRQCDAMVVVGGKHSANSAGLAKICREHCPQVQFIENAKELDTSLLETPETVGVVSGASVPAWILKEVKQTMCDEIKMPADEKIEEISTPVTENAQPIEEEESFEALLESSIKTIYNGETVKGIVAAITPTEISVDLGIKHSGYIPMEDFMDDSDAKPEDVIHVGDTIEACVVRVNDVEGTVMLSKRRLDAAKTWEVVEAAVEDGTVLEGVVTEDNKGGVVVTIKGLRVFVPASQSGLPREAEMSQLLKQKVRLKITEVNRGRKRIVGSIRAVSAKERKEKAELVWNEIENGKPYKGIVKSLTSYGAFVDIGGVDGMVHVSELSWKRVGNPADILSVGDAIDVYVISFDKDNRKISLGYKDPSGDPWTVFTSTYKVNDIASVKIVKLMSFGAFAEIVEGVDGLIHISQIADRRIGKPDEVLTVGETVSAKITAIDEDKKKVSLSIRALSEPAPAPEKAEDGEVAPVAAKPEADALVFEISETGEASGVTPEEAE